MAGIVGLGQDHADRLPAGGRPGRVLRHRSVARRRLGRAHRPTWSGRWRTILKQEPAVADYSAIDRAQLHRQLLAAQRRVPDRLAEAVRGAHRAVQSAQALIASLGAQVPPAARRRGRAAGAAADHRPGHRRRVHLRAAGHRRRHPQGAGAGAARIVGRRQPGSQSSAACSARSPPTTPSVYLDIDRDKAQILKVDRRAIFQALQASLGGYYVNDMNLFGRTWQVQVQAEAEDRASIDDIYRINVRSADGKMIPLRSLVEVRPVIGPQALIRYNNRSR